VLRHINNRVQLWAAMTLVIAYAFCLLVPPVALALGDAGQPAPCHTELSHQPAATHVHADGTVHSHTPAAAQPAGQHDSDDGMNHYGSNRMCCGLACLSAIALDTRMVLAGASRFTMISWQDADRPLGRTPDRLDRPPIVSSSL
jgi:hypothetical protein